MIKQKNFLFFKFNQKITAATYVKMKSFLIYLKYLDQELNKNFII